MSVRRVWIEEGCICCGLSHSTVPDLIEIPPGSKTAVIKAGIDPEPFTAEIKAAAESCPMAVLKYEEA